MAFQIHYDQTGLTSPFVSSKVMVINRMKCMDGWYQLISVHDCMLVQLGVAEVNQRFRSFTLIITMYSKGNLLKSPPSLDGPFAGPSRTANKKWKQRKPRTNIKNHRITNRMVRIDPNKDDYSTWRSTMPRPTGCWVRLKPF